MFSYLALYYESLQNLVEGRREVLHDENFKFEDGKTVKEKAEILEKRLSSFANKNFDKIKKTTKINFKK